MRRIVNNDKRQTMSLLPREASMLVNKARYSLGLNLRRTICVLVLLFISSIELLASNTVHKDLTSPNQILP